MKPTLSPGYVPKELNQKIPSREFLLGWLMGHFHSNKYKNMDKYLNELTREDLYTQYLIVKAAK